MITIQPIDIMPLFLYVDILNFFYCFNFLDRVGLIKSVDGRGLPIYYRQVCVFFSFDLVFRNLLIMSYKDSLPYFLLQVIVISSLLDTTFYIEQIQLCIFKSQFLSILLLTVGDTHHSSFIFILCSSNYNTIKVFNVIEDLESNTFLQSTSRKDLKGNILLHSN